MASVGTQSPFLLRMLIFKSHSACCPKDLGIPASVVEVLAAPAPSALARPNSFFNCCVLVWVSLSLCLRCCLWAAAAQGCRPWARRRSIRGTWWPPAAAAGTARGRCPDGGARHVFAWLPHRPPPSLVCFSPLSLSFLPLKLKDLIALPCKIRLLLYLKKLKIYKENSVLAWFQWQCWSDMLTRVCVQALLLLMCPHGRFLLSQHQAPLNAFLFLRCSRLSQTTCSTSTTISNRWAYSRILEAIQFRTLGPFSFPFFSDFREHMFKLCARDRQISPFSWLQLIAYI